MIADLPAVIQSPARTSAVLFGRRLWWRQVQIAKSVDRHKRTSVKGCTGWGKTYVAADIAARHLLRYEDGIVLVTATRWKQIEKQFMAELRTLVGGALGRLDLPQPDKTRWELGPKRYLECISPNDEEGAGGYHEGHPLVIKDEASGMKPERHAGLEGVMSAGDARMLELGNPLNATGDFVDHHTKQRSIYNCFTVPAWETPNFAPLMERAQAAGISGRDMVSFMCDVLLATSEDELASWIVHPKLTSPVWVREAVGMWGPGNPKFDARVCAQFPQYSTSALFPLALIEAAGETDPVDDGVSPIHAGLDVAGPGRDLTVLALRCGRSLLAVIPFPQSDARGPVIDRLRQVGQKRLKRITYDADGIGHYFGAALEDAFRPWHVELVGVRGGTNAPDEERFRNLRAQIHWSFRDRLEAGDVWGLTDESATSQLVAMEYTHDNRGRIQVTEKAADSPDEAEAVLYCYWQPAIQRAYVPDQGAATTRAWKTGH